jgi:hypothetical protein
MTITDMVKELEFIKADNKTCTEVIASKTASKEEKAECRMRILENNHQKIHLESTLAAIKYDPLF